jgi:hypothetical protein
MHFYLKLFLHCEVLSAEGTQFAPSGILHITLQVFPDKSCKFCRYETTKHSPPPNIDIWRRDVWLPLRLFTPF